MPDTVRAKEGAKRENLPNLSDVELLRQKAASHLSAREWPESIRKDEWAGMVEELARDLLRVCDELERRKRASTPACGAHSPT